MADPPPFSDPGDDTDARSGLELTTGIPRWVKVFGIIGLALVLLLVIVLLIGGGGEHGPGRHGLGGQAPSIGVTAQDVPRP